MQSLIDSLRGIIGIPEFYDSVTGVCDYAGMIEYFVAAVVLCLVISSVFRFLGKLVDR